MQGHKNHFHKKIFLFSVLLIAASSVVYAQVSSVQYGRNRVQFKNFKWQYYQTRNFNAYYNQDGQEIAKYVAQVGE